jgi:hypothetical protein
MLGAAGGSGIVVVKEPSVSIPASAPGVWSLEEVYDLAVDGEWTGF